MSLLHTGDADPSISTSTSTPCYGDVVTLVCHHPELASNPGRYLSIFPHWRENGVWVSPGPFGEEYLQHNASEDFTHTTLTINITVDHFRNKSFNYSCSLISPYNLLSSPVETSEMSLWILLVSGY